MRAGEAQIVGAERAPNEQRDALHCVINVDRDGRITQFSPAAERIFGRPRADALGRELGEMIAPPALREHSSRALASVRESCDAQAPGHLIELTAMRAEGEEFPAELAITRVEGDPPAFSVFLRDITERKRARDEIELRYAATRSFTDATSHLEGVGGFLRTLAEWFEWEHAALWEFDGRRQQLHARRIWQAPALSGLKLAAKTRELPAGDDEPAARVWESGMPVWIEDIEHLHRFARGASARAAGIRSAACFPVLLHDRMIGVIELLSCRVRARDGRQLELMTRVSRELAHFVATKRLEARLSQQKEAARAIRSRTDFLSRVSHEFRTPLNSILGFAQLLEMGELSARQAESVEQIVGRHLTALQPPDNSHGILADQIVAHGVILSDFKAFGRAVRF